MRFIAATVARRTGETAKTFITLYSFASGPVIDGAQSARADFHGYVTQAVGEAAIAARDAGSLAQIGDTTVWSSGIVQFVLDGATDIQALAYNALKAQLTARGVIGIEDSFDTGHTA